ncbi:non-ribosomal peptide synthetase, partial [Ferruginibacter sp.]|uniref:non-ribosomal peptide synthetase n=1 Tax=Ferruginibacter sp. TaxID=1940288 RepID=UPI00198E3732
VDDQVKIRGYRVELGEIENILRQCNGIELCAVIAKEDKGGVKNLVAYVTSNGSISTHNVEQYLQAALPDYMVPSAIIELDEMPLMINGKIDKKALPDPDMQQNTSTGFVAPDTEAEQKMAAIWCNILEEEIIGVHDDFFALGGHSLLAVRLISAIRKEFKIEIPISHVFDFPTIALLAAELNTQTDVNLLPPVQKASPRPERIPLSFGQERLWFLDKLQGSVQYHVPLVLKLKGDVKTDAIAYSIKNIIDRHEVLRTVFEEDEGQPFQRVMAVDNWEMSITDGSGFFEGKDLTDYVEKVISVPFDLSKDFMLRAEIINIRINENILVLVLHHIVSDAWSKNILVQEIVNCYNEFTGKSIHVTSPPSIQYSDFAIWQRNYLNEAVLQSKLDFWKQNLEDLPILQLPTDFTRPAIQSINGSLLSGSINKEITTGLQAISQTNNCTLFMTLLSSFNVLLYKYSSQDDICIGSPVAGRQQIELDKLIGLFVNTIVFRTKIDSSNHFINLLQQVKITTINALNNQEAPFEKVVEAVVKERDLSRSPLFQVAFVLRNIGELLNVAFSGINLEDIPFQHKTSMYDMVFYVTETDNTLDITIEYNTDLFREQTMGRMLLQYQTLLGNISANPYQKIDDLQVLTQSDHNLLDSFNNTYCNYQTGKTIIDIIEEQVEKTPSRIALVFNDETLSYKQLDDQSNQLAHFLVSKGVVAEAVIPICIDRSLNMMIGLLGIMKAGAAYVPIDPDYPEERIEHILQDTKASIIICTASTRAKIKSDEYLYVIELDSDQESIVSFPSYRCTKHLLPHHLAYVIYTSGSTGKPKGAMNTHAGLYNRLSWAQQYFKLSANDVLLQKTTFAFDVSVWELFWPLMAGARLVFAKVGGHKDLQYLIELIEAKNITVLHFVPSVLAIFMQQPGIQNCTSLQKVLCSGEALKPNHVNLFKHTMPLVKLYNLYGPTEAAIDVTCWEVPDVQEEITTVPIGRPIANTRLLILDKHGAKVPIGVPGELHIAGVQVGRGYLNNETLTNKKFVPDPFSIGKKMYKSGDLCKWMEDGNIEFLGRFDDQVKVRGFRIELGEIEHMLEKSDYVKNAKILAATDEVSDDKHLTAYIEINEKKYPLLASYQQLIQTPPLSATDLKILPNHLPIFGSNDNEIAFLYDEIFKDEVYLKHGIVLSSNSTVIDVGANIGFFSLFVNLLSKNIRVFSFEPMPDVFKYLQANFNLYQVPGKVFQLALSNKEEEIEFSYFPQMTILSSLNAIEGDIKNVLKSYLVNNSDTELLTENEIEEILDVKLASSKVNCKATTLSTIIRNEEIDKIDLLKIDVENAEHLVLDGIENEHWHKIENLIIEVHDNDGRLNNIKTLLQSKGFNITIEKENLLSGKNQLYNIYAQRLVANQISTSVKIDQNRVAEWMHPDDFIKRIQKGLHKTLPEYMIPAQFILVDKLPLNSNGKLDSKALARFKPLQKMLRPYVAPKTPSQSKLTEIWKTLLRKDKIGINDSFFELGGHSLMVMRMVSAIKKQFSLAVPIPIIFQLNNIEELGNYIDWQLHQIAEDPSETLEVINL